MLRTLSGILHLGNIEVSPSPKCGEEGSWIDPSDPHLASAARLLGEGGRER